MKNLYKFFCLLLLSLYSLSASSQCTINSFTAILQNCDLDEAFIALEIDAVDFGLNGFTVNVNGVPYFSGIYNPNNIYTVGVLGECGPNINITITDDDDPNCSASFDYGPACCPCIMWAPLFGASICSNGTFDMEIDLEQIYGSCNFYDWLIIVDGVEYVLENTNNDELWDAFDVLATDQVITFQLCGYDPDMVCETYIIDNPCYAVPCEINSFTAEMDTTLCIGEIVGITFDFDASGFGLNGFIATDGTGTEFYNLGDDYIFYSTSECNDDIIFSIYDEDDPNCISTITVQPVCCPCKVTTVSATATTCDNGKFDLDINLNIDSGTCLWYPWIVTIEGIDYNLIAGNNSYLAEDIMATDSLLTILVCSLAPTGECYSLDILNPCFVSTNTCIISSFVAEYDSLSCNGEIIDITFDFNAIDFGQNGFIVSYGQQSQGYDIGDDYIFSVLTDCNDSLSITITDNSDPNCTATLDLGPACCPCIINDPIINSTACDAGSFDLEIDFSIVSGSCINDDWFVVIDGQNYDLTWNGSINIVEDIIAMDSIITISLCTSSATGECFDYEIENPCFDSASTCLINSFDASYDATSCMGEIIVVEFEFDAVDFGQSGFTIYAGGSSASYSIGDDYTFYAISDCTDSLTVTIVDNVVGNCTETVTLAPACCPCEINDPTVTTTACQGGKFDILIDFFVDSGSCVNYDWFITFDGEDYDLAWNGTALEVQELMSPDSLITFTLCTYSPTGECYDLTVVNPCYTPPSNCMIDYFLVAYDTTACFGEIIDVIFEFTATDFGQDGFTLTDGSSSQFYNLGDNYTFYTLSDCSDSLTFTITDELDPDCSSSLTLGPACCPCEITTPIITTSDCVDDKFDVFLDFTLESGSCINYDWELTVEGETYDLVWNGNSLEASDVMATDSLITVTLCTLSPTDECYDYSIENPCFVTTNTIVFSSFNMQLKDSDCDSAGNAIVVVEYDVENPGDEGFTIAADGVSLGTFNYGESLELALEPKCYEMTSFTIQDIKYPSGTATSELDVCCETSSVKNTFQDELQIINENDICTIVNNSAAHVQVYISHVSGIILHDKIISSGNQNEFYMGSCPNGIYYLSIQDKKGNTYNKKLVIIRG